jgi:hypothetical protein
MVKSAARRATAAVGQATDGFIWTTYIPAADAPAWHDGYPGLHRNKPHPCEGCGKKYAPITYRHRWRCTPCAQDVLDGVTIIDKPEYPNDYQPEPRWRDVSPEAHLTRRATYERFCETWRLRLCEQAPDAPWLRTWDQSSVPTDSLDRPWRFLFEEWRCVQNWGWNSDDGCYWDLRPVPGRLPFRMRIVICHYPQLHTCHFIVAEPTVHLPRHLRGGYGTGTFTIAERVESTNIGTRQGSAAWVGKRTVLQEVRARLAALDNTAKGRPYRWHRPGHGRTWRPQVTPPLRPGTSRQRTPRLERRHQSPGIPMALPVKPSPGWEANDALDSETGDLASLVGETTASEASTWLGIRHRLQRQQPPARQSRLLVQHPRRHILLRPVEDTSRAQPPCRRQLTAAFYCNRRPKRLLLERGCTDGTGPRPSLEP